MVQMQGVQLTISLSSFDLSSALVQAIKEQGIELHNGDIIVVSSKHVAVKQGRTRVLSEIVPTAEAVTLAERLHISNQLAALLLECSERILGRDPSGAIITATQGTYLVNGGIELLDAEREIVALPPEDPVHEAEQIRRLIYSEFGVEVGILVASQAILVGRKGTGGVAIAVSGFFPVIDERGKPDLFGNPMKFTTRGLANMLAGAAQLLLSDSEACVIVTNSGAEMVNQSFSFSDMGIPPEEDIFPNTEPTDPNNV
ncbi:MAG: coenzyme F420-0:L-glutamate ligase [Chloroflexi bacterium]|nr:coenzyme F420-0:L-glutamate ligase [Chloroflexota bacterium]